jgi:hypothetical protein
LVAGCEQSLSLHLCAYRSSSKELRAALNVSGTTVRSLRRKGLEEPLLEFNPL